MYFIFDILEMVDQYQIMSAYLSPTHSFPDKAVIGNMNQQFVGMAAVPEMLLCRTG